MERERVPKALPRHRASRKRVLLAEYNLTNQMLARRVLEKMDHDVVVANKKGIFVHVSEPARH